MEEEREGPVDETQRERVRERRQRESSGKSKAFNIERRRMEATVKTR